MSDLAVNWVAIAPSQWARRLRCSALAVTFAAVAAVVSIHVLASPAVAAAVALCAGLAAGYLALRAARTATIPDRAWSVAPDGRIAVRYGASVQRDAELVFASAALVVVRAGGQSLEIWRDAAPVRAFRRLGVAARWGAARKGVRRVEDRQAGQPNDRT